VVVAVAVAVEAVPEEPEPVPEPATVEAGEPSAVATEPEYHPLALQEPPPGTEPIARPEPAPAYEVPPPAAEKPAEVYAYEPEPPVVETPAPVLAPQPAPLSRPALVEAEPIDPLAITGAKGLVRRAAPALIIAGVVIVGVIVWLAMR
jgi:hypothetical protein